MGSSKKSTDLYKQAGDEIEMLRKSSRKSSRSRPSSTKFPKSQHQQRVSSKDNNNNGDMSGMQNDLSRSVEGGKYRNKVLAEVGLDDILVDDDEEVDIQQQQHNSIKKNTRKDRNKSDRRRKVRLSQELRTNEAARIKAKIRSSPNDDDDYEDENDEEEGLNYNEEDELYPEDEYDSFNNSNEERSNSSYCNATMRRIIGKLLYASIAIVFALYIFYGDEIFTNTNQSTTANEDDINNDEETANHPTKDGYIEGYKDARVPDDDIAQFGGGILGAEAFGKKNEGGGLDFFNDDDQQQNVETEEEEQQLQPGVHEHTGIAKTDLLWEQLDGYSEMVVPYNSAHELPVFWHVSFDE
jgi:hypothetical protein